MRIYSSFIKPFLDFVIALIVLIISFPLLICVALVIALTHEGAIFFIQERPGFKLKPFKIIKFKTMLDKCDPDGRLLPEAERLTKIGRLIRTLSLDEFPQLFNVLKGEMSFIGPRPLVMRYIPRYSASQLKRHDVKPGITGLAQVNGRNSISWEEKFNYDLYYVEHQSLWLDLTILYKTIFTVIYRKGVSSRNSVTMEEFMGSRADG